MAKDRIASLDGMRLIAAFLITVMHGGWSQTVFGSIMMQVSRIAVPYFCVLSGYFYCRERTGDQIKKYMRLIVYGLIISIPIDYILFRDFTYMVHELSKFTQPRFYLFNSLPFFHIGWFLMAYIYILVILYIIKNDTLRYVLGVLSFIFALVAGPYSRVLGLEVDSFLWNCSSFSIFCWYILGIVISRYQQDILKFVSSFPSWVLILASILFSLMQFGEYALIQKILMLPCGGTTYFSTLVAVSLIFILLLRHRNIFVPIHSRSSFFVFLYHIPVLYIIASIFDPSKFSCKYDPLIDLDCYKWVVMNGYTLFLLTMLLYWISNAINKRIRLWQ